MPHLGRPSPVACARKSGAFALRAFPESAQMPIPPLKQWGYLGVIFFFAISGYVICLIAVRPSFSPLSFAIKRLFRLY